MITVGSYVRYSDAALARAFDRADLVHAVGVAEEFDHLTGKWDVRWSNFHPPFGDTNPTPPGDVVIASPTWMTEHGWEPPKGPPAFQQALYEDPNPTWAPAPREYRYAAVNRPPGIGTVPKGMIRVEPQPAGNTVARHGIVVYDRPLTKEEYEGYELWPYKTVAEVTAEALTAFSEYGQEYADAVREDGLDMLRGVLDLRHVYTDLEGEALLRHVADALLAKYPALKQPAPESPPPGALWAMTRDRYEAASGMPIHPDGERTERDVEEAERDLRKSARVYVDALGGVGKLSVKAPASATFHEVIGAAEWAAKNVRVEAGKRKSYEVDRFEARRLNRELSRFREHRWHVAAALRDGLPVPAGIVDEYPELRWWASIPTFLQGYGAREGDVAGRPAWVLDTGKVGPIWIERGPPTEENPGLGVTVLDGDRIQELMPTGRPQLAEKLWFAQIGLYSADQLTVGLAGKRIASFAVHAVGSSDLGPLRMHLDFLGARGAPTDVSFPRKRTLREEQDEEAAKHEARAAERTKTPVVLTSGFDLGTWASDKVGIGVRNGTRYTMQAILDGGGPGRVEAPITFTVHTAGVLQNKVSPKEMEVEGYQITTDGRVILSVTDQPWRSRNGSRSDKAEADRQRGVLFAAAGGRDAIDAAAQRAWPILRAGFVAAARHKDPKWDGEDELADEAPMNDFWRTLYAAAIAGDTAPPEAKAVPPIAPGQGPWWEASAKEIVGKELWKDMAFRSAFLAALRQHVALAHETTPGTTHLQFGGEVTIAGERVVRTGFPDRKAAHDWVQAAGYAAARENKKATKTSVRGQGGTFAHDAHGVPYALTPLSEIVDVDDRPRANKVIRAVLEWLAPGISWSVKVGAGAGGGDDTRVEAGETVQLHRARAGAKIVAEDVNRARAALDSMGFTLAAGGVQNPWGGSVECYGTARSRLFVVAPAVSTARAAAGGTKTAKPTTPAPTTPKRGRTPAPTEDDPAAGGGMGPGVEGVRFDRSAIHASLTSWGVYRWILPDGGSVWIGSRPNLENGVVKSRTWQGRRYAAGVRPHPVAPVTAREETAPALQLAKVLTEAAERWGILPRAPVGWAWGADEDGGGIWLSTSRSDRPDVFVDYLVDGRTRFRWPSGETFDDLETAVTRDPRMTVPPSPPSAAPERRGDAGYDSTLVDARLGLERLLTPHLRGVKPDWRLLQDVLRILQEAPREVGVLLYRHEAHVAIRAGEPSGRVYLNSGLLLPTSTLRHEDATIHHAVARVLAAQGGIDFPPHRVMSLPPVAKVGPRWTWVLPVDEDDPVLATKPGRPCTWVATADAPAEIRALVVALPLSSRTAPDGSATTPAIDALRKAIGRSVTTHELASEAIAKYGWKTGLPDFPKYLGDPAPTLNRWDRRKLLRLSEWIDVNGGMPDHPYRDALRVEARRLNPEPTPEPPKAPDPVGDEYNFDMGSSKRKKPATEPPVPEEISLGEPIPPTIAPCDVPPDVVLRTRTDHRNLLRGDLTPLSAEEREASRRQFPDPTSLEPVGYGRRGQRWIAITDDGRDYPWTDPLPGSLVVSLPPDVASAFAPLLASLGTGDRQWRDRVLDQLLHASDVDPDTVPGAPTTTVRSAARAALTALRKDEHHRAVWADRSVWSWLCEHPASATEIRPAWEAGDYSVLLAHLGRERGPVAELVRTAASLRGVRAASVAATGTDRHRVGLPTALLDAVAPGGSDASWLAEILATGQVQARQTILILSVPDYLRLRRVLLGSVPEWQEGARTSPEERRTYQGWIDRVRALPDLEAPKDPAPPTWGAPTGHLSGHQKALVRALAERTGHVPALSGYDVDVAWREPEGRTIVRLAAQNPPRVLAFVLPADTGEPVHLPVAAKPGVGDALLALDFLDRAPRGQNPTVTRAVERCLAKVGRVERMIASGVPKGQDPSWWAFSRGLSRTPVGSDRTRTDQEWQNALVLGQTWLRTVLPDLSIVTKRGEDACGAFACAYRTGRLPGRVVKITGDATDAVAWRHVLDVEIPGLAATSWVAHLPVEGSRPIFGIVQEEVGPLTAWERRFLDGRGGHRSLLEGGKGSERLWKDAVRTYATTPGVTAGRARNLETNVLRLRRTLRMLDRDHGIRLHDLHGGNVRRRSDGAWVITDLGLSSSGPIDVPSAAVTDLRRLVATPGPVPPPAAGSSSVVERFPSREIPPEILAVTPDLVRLAQAEYDAWDQDEDGMDEELGSGGICHLIADAFAGRFVDAGHACATVSAQIGEVHVYTVVRLPSGVWLVDVHPSTYETGGGYDWKKIPGVRFDVSDLIVERLSPRPGDFRDYVDDYEEDEDDAPGDEPDA